MKGVLALNESLLHSLRKGGYILYARHGEATVGSDLPNLDFQDCSTQRNLSEYGRQQAIYYGKMLRYWQIPILPFVSTSPFCRTIETAQLAFESAHVQVNPFWYEIYRLSENNVTSSKSQMILNHFQSILEIPPLEGQNKVIVAHSFPKGVGLGEIPYMGTVVVKPKGVGNGYEVVQQLDLEDWGKLDI